MKTLVTGGGGFAGRHLLRELLETGTTKITATVVGAPPEFEAGDPLAGVEWLSMDVTDAASVQEAIERSNPERIYHLAGQASVGQSLDAPLTTWDVNATGTLRVLAALARLPEASRRLLLISSAEVYGPVAEAAQPIREEAGYRPVTPYGASKAAAEIAALQESRRTGIEVVVARSFNHIGPGQDERFVVPSIARQLARIARNAETEPVLQAGNLSVARDFLDVRDAVHGYRVLMERGTSGAVYNVCSGTAISLAEVARRMIELSETGARLELDPERVRSVDIPSLRGDPSRLRDLGWTPGYDLDRTLRDLLAEAFGAG